MINKLLAICLLAISVVVLWQLNPSQEAPNASQQVPFANESLNKQALALANQMGGLSDKQFIDHWMH